jgi:hypothetical protein
VHILVLFDTVKRNPTAYLRVYETMTIMLLGGLLLPVQLSRFLSCKPWVDFLFSICYNFYAR